MATYYHAIWFSPRRDGQADWLGSLVKEDGKWKFHYRFRYYVDDKTHGSADRKNRYTAFMRDDSNESFARGLLAVESMLPFFEQQWGPVERVDMQCLDSDPKFFFELASRPWAHVRREL